MKDRLFYFFTYDGFRKVGKALYYDTNTISPDAVGQQQRRYRHFAIAVPDIANAQVSPPPITRRPPPIPMHLSLHASARPASSSSSTQSTAAPSRFAKEDLFFPRLDYHINSKNDAFVDFNFANFNSTYGYNSSPTFTNSSPSTNATTYYHERFLVGGIDHRRSAAACVNQVHGQWGRDLETAGANAAGPSVARRRRSPSACPTLCPA